MKTNYHITILTLVVTFCACSKVENNDGNDLPGTLKVLEYRPAPGQFINENMDCKTMGEANAWAQERLEKGSFVSLGSFGGYLTVQMPKTVKNRKDYDFAITGNPFDGSSEPGVVWVSEDTNGNGLADDAWYELQGSDLAGTDRTYEVTYHRPAASGDISWTDNKGGNGVIKHLPQFHDQMYYPAWITENTYTLKGSLLQPRPENVNGIWQNKSFGWGYADNLGSDIEKKSNGSYRYNQFNLDNAIDAEGKPVVLQQIHFVKVQSAILHNVESIGEVSTEVTGFKAF